MDNIKTIVSKVIGEIDVRKTHTSSDYDGIWKRVLSKQELEHIEFIGEKDGMLMVLVDSPAWLFQINSRKQAILDKIKLENPLVKNIHFKIGKVK